MSIHKELAVEDEKITRVKSTYALHEGGLASLEAAEKHTGIKLNDADLIAISDLLSSSFKYSGRE